MTVDFREYQSKLVELQREFHRFPELAFHEIKTTAFIVNYLMKLGYDVVQMDPSGCSAMLPQKKKGRTIILRTEIDALPIQELTNLSYQSEFNGVMHACGHDANIAIALVFAELLAKDYYLFPVSIKFIFEPAEEIGKGTRFMLEQGVLKNPDVDELVMFHFVNKEKAGMEINNGITSGTVGKIKIYIKGKSTHWAKHDQGIDAITISGKVIKMVEDLNHHYATKDVFIIGLGSIEGGSSSSTMAGEVKIAGNIRSVSKVDYDCIADEIRNQLRKIEELTGCEIIFDVNRDPILPIINHEKLVKRAKIVGKKVWNESFFVETKVYLAGDNAYQYFEKVPGILLVFAMPGDTRYALHNPHFILDETYFWKALETLYQFFMAS